MPFQDLINRQFGKLTPLKPVKMTFRRIGWLCRCTCGNTVVVAGTLLRSGHSKSCGCLQRETARRCNTKHGMYQSREYQVWAGMLQRCYNPKEPSYSNYGARGISVCPQWRDSFERFFKDMGRRPSPKHSLDRIDNSAGYSPANCRWASKKEQARNQRGNHVLTLKGKSMTVVQWAEVTGISISALRHRLERGWPIAAVLSTPVHK